MAVLKLAVFAGVYEWVDETVHEKHYYLLLL